MKVSIVIPAYNEEKGIESVIKKFKAVAKKNKISIEVIVIDDGSSDKTAKVAKKQRVKVILHPKNAGYGRALQSGIQAARYQNIVICDADGSYPVKEFPKLLNFLNKGFDMVVGARKRRHYKESLLKHPARLFFKFLSEFVTGTKIPDVNSGFRAFKKNEVSKFLKYTCSTFSFSTSLTLIYLLENKFVKYYPIDYFTRKGKSKINYLRDTLRAGQILTEIIILYNPIKLFLLLALFSLLFTFINLKIYTLNESVLFLVLFALCFLTTVVVLCLGLIASIFKKRD